MDDKAQSPIAVSGLRKKFGEQAVLNGLDLEVKQGETVAVLGRSGGGKSVLLKLLIGLQPPDAGSVRVAGQEIVGLDRRDLDAVRRKMGFLFQDSALYDSLTVSENVAFPLLRNSGMNEEERTKRIEELLHGVGMDRDLDKLPSEISGGMKKRVGLARALALDPEILLFDEPTAGLDPITAAEIGQLILDLKSRRKMTGVVVTHDIRGAKIFADRMVLMHEGKILAEGSFDDLRRNRDPFVVRFLDDSD
jgi:phospholipid/cholesterol/gamma-HCH transport system ATP-binding protein